MRFISLCFIVQLGLELEGKMGETGWATPDVPERESSALRFGFGRLTGEPALSGHPLDLPGTAREVSPQTTAAL